MSKHRFQLEIRYCEAIAEAETGEDWMPPSWLDSVEGVPMQKRDSVWARMLVLQRRLISVGQLRSPDHWNTEGQLPDKKNFYAIKVDRLRAYGWYSTRDSGVFYISHFALKKGQKLSAKDSRQVVANWRKIEERSS